MPHLDCIPVRAARAPRSCSRAGSVGTIVLACSLVATLLVPACAPRQSRLIVIDAGASYTTDEIDRSSAAAQLGPAASLASVQGAQGRQEALAGLRLSGAEGVRTADLLTRTFPPGATAVPVRIERATVDGTDALLVTEAAPGAGGSLTTRRVWVLRYSDGAVLHSVSYR